VRIAGVIAGLATGVAVGMSRIALDAHSPSEAIAGFVVGALTALVFVRYWWDAQPVQLSATAVAVSLVAITIALNSVHLPTHRWITNIALVISGHGHPYIRARWKANHGQRHPAPPISQTRDALSVPVPHSG
jgi:hypothetical protein